MTKPDDIPQDVWDKAERFAAGPGQGSRREMAARALIAGKEEEREAITNIVRVMTAYDRNDFGIIDAIRARSPHPLPA